MQLHALVVVLAGCAASTLAQTCARPEPAGAAFPTLLDPIVEVVYADGYVTFGSMLLPDAPAPSCGWPLVVFVHPLGASRAHDIGLQQRLCGLGYAVWSYDVRGQGSGLVEPRNDSHPSNGTALWGPAERFDLAEQIQFVAGRPAWQNVVDATRVAVVGSSQGGVHAWNAAAASGTVLTMAGRGSLPFPVIRCAVAKDYVAEPVLDWLRDGILFSNWFVNQVTDDVVHQGFRLDSTFRQAAAAAFRAQDPQALLTAWQAEGRRIDSMLLQSTVPVLYSHAYHDLIDSPLPTLQVLQNMTPPTRALLSTIGHNTPDNVHERAYRDQIIARWLGRWLWGEQNEVDREPRFVLSEMPLDRTLREDPNHPWSRLHGGDPLQSAQVVRFHLHGDGTMQETAPTQAQTAGVVDHDIVDPLFTPDAWLASGNTRALPAVLQAVPLSELTYAAPALADESELVASPRLHVVVTPSAPHWMLAALLSAEPPGGEEVMLSSFAAARDDATFIVPETVEIALPPVAARLPAGTVLRLRLRNLWLREPPMDRQLEVTPMFTPFRLDVAHDAANGSWLELPLVPPQPTLVARVVDLPIETMPPVQMTIRGGRDRAGRIYFVTASVSGQLPGAAYLNTVVPIEVDWLTGIVTVSANTSEFRRFLGTLDGSGESTATFDLSPFAPLDPAFRGLRVTFAGFVWDDLAGTTGAASNAVDVILR